MLTHSRVARDIGAPGAIVDGGKKLAAGQSFGAERLGGRRQWLDSVGYREGAAACIVDSEVFMTLAIIGTAILLTSCVTGSALAEDRTVTVLVPANSTIATEKSTESYNWALTRPPKAADVSTTTAANSEVFENITIAPGKTFTVASAMDYSSSITVAITVECTICTTTATSLGNSGLVLLAGWLVPTALGYVVAENKTATSFPYTDAGGVIFNVYGSQFQLLLQNKGAASIVIRQLTLFQRSR
jgi:hypothetical protein